MQEFDTYSDFVKLVPEYHREIRELLEGYEKYFRWSPEEVVLDIGCGPGDLTHHVLYQWLPKECKKTVLGVDVTPDMIDACNKRIKNTDIFFETFDIADKKLDVIIEDEKFNKGFTKMFSFNVLHWLNNLEVAFQNMYELLKPGGQILAMFPVSRQYQTLYRQMQAKEPWSELLKGVQREVPDYFIKDRGPKEEFVELVKNAGFQVVDCTYIITDDEFPNEDAYKKLIGSLDAHFGKIPTNLQPKYLEECLEMMKQQNNVASFEDGRIIVKEKRIIAFVEKPLEEFGKKINGNHF